jgi:hypothetical protein
MQSTDELKCATLRCLRERKRERHARRIISIVHTSWARWCSLECEQPKAQRPGGTQSWRMTTSVALKLLPDLQGCQNSTRLNFLPATSPKPTALEKRRRPPIFKTAHPQHHLTHRHVVEARSPRLQTCGCAKDLCSRSCPHLCRRRWPGSEAPDRCLRP